MKLLLDTHIFLWSLLEPSHLAKRVAAELENRSNGLWLSPIVIWEALVLAEKGHVIHWTLANSGFSPAGTKVAPTERKHTIC